MEGQAVPDDLHDRSRFYLRLRHLRKTGEFHYPGQGWAFTTDGKQIYMDGSRDVNAEASDPEIRIWDPDTLKETGVIHGDRRGPAGPRT